MSTVFLVQSEPGFWVRLMAPQVHAAGHRAVLVTTPLTDRQRQAAAELVDEIVEMDDVNDPDVLAATVRELAGEARIITCTDAAMVAASRAAELLGVARTPARVYAGVRNKFAARRTLDAAGLPGPRFALLERAEDAPAVAEQVGLPAVIKPVNGSGSNLVRVVRTVDELAAAYRLLAERLPGSMGGLYDRPIGGIDPTRVFLVETRLEGPEYCLDVVIRDGVVEPLKLVSKPFMDETFFEHVFVCPPFDLPAGREELVRERVVASVLALGLDNTVAHVELIDDVTTGPAIIEVNVGRPGGGLVSALNELTSGINLFAECLAATLGDPSPPRTPPKITIPLAYLIIFGTGKGRLVKIHGLDDVADLPEVLEVVPTVEPGQILSDDHEVLAVNLLVAGFFDADELAALYDEAAKLIRLETEPVGGTDPS
jgi:biotin carboxylase